MPTRRARLTLLAAGAIALWDFSGLDMAAARLFGGPGGFALQNDFWLEAVMHRGMRDLAWLLLAVLVAGSVRPVGFLRRLSRAERLQLWMSALACLGLVVLFKRISSTSCPWDLQAFGGTAQHVSHWLAGRFDGGGGHCFPAGHASAGFAFLGSWFALYRRLPRLASRWLWASLAMGFLLGLSQQVRGAHFMSHTLWTAWLCWTCGWAVDGAFHLKAPARKNIPFSGKNGEFHSN